MTQVEFEEKLHFTFPKSRFTVLEFSGLNKPGIIRCDKCGNLISYKAIGNKLNKDKLCKRCETKYGEIFLDLCKKYDVSVIEWNKNNKSPSKLHCNKCNKDFSKSVDNSVAKMSINCPYCSSKSPAHEYINFQERLDNTFGINEYEILSTNFTGADKILIRHKCGFIYKTRFYDFIKSYGCPKCSPKISKGEHAIINFLEANLIEYEYQYSIIETKQRFDFFIPKLNLAIEYNGEQHYKPTFGLESYEQTIANDNKKIEYCKNHNIQLLVISYKQYNQIPELLSFLKSSTTIPRGVEKN